MSRLPLGAQAGADAPAHRRFSARLGKRAARGEGEAFAAIFERYHQELYRYCLSIVRDREDAEDALQATMAAALRALPGEDRDIALRPWLYRVAHNESISLLRGRTPMADAEPEEELEALTGSVPAEAEQRDRLRSLVSDLQALPERQRSALVMRELNDLSYAEIAAGLECSEAAARQTVYEARTALFTFEEGRSMDCEPIREAISSRDGRRLRGRKVRAHLRVCEGCRDFEAVIAQRREDMQALFPPLPALAASGMLAGLVGGTGGGAGLAGAGAGAAATGGGAGILGTGVAGGLAIKGASIVAAAAVAAGAADLGGVIDLPNPFTGNDSDPARESGGSDGGGTAGTSDEAGGAASEPGEAAGADGGSGAANGHGSSGAAGAEGGRGGSAASPGQAGEHGGSAAAPGQTGVNGGAAQAPGQNGTSPGQAGTSPGQAGTTPGQSGSSPGKSESAPGQSSSPGNSGTAPGQSASSSPGNSGSAPGQSGDSPGNSGSAPGQSIVSPGNSASAGTKVPGTPATPTPPVKPQTPATPQGPPAGVPGNGHGPDELVEAVGNLLPGSA